MKFTKEDKVILKYVLFMIITIIVYLLILKNVTDGNN